MSKLFCQLQNLMEISEKYKSLPAMYYFIKNYAFNKCCNYVSKDIRVFTPEERAIFDNLLNDYKNELAVNRPNYNVTKDEYIKFLENYFSGVDFDHANLKIIETCRDLTEIVSVYGELEDLWTRRSKINIININFNKLNYLVEYFTKKINLLQSPPATTKIIYQPSTQTTKSNNTKSSDEVMLPDVKGNGKISDSHVANIDVGYIPRLVDKTLLNILPINKSSSNYTKLKEKIREHMEYSGLELDFHKLELAKDHVEAAIYYLRHIQD
jgi:hypothetical protein